MKTPPKTSQDTEKTKMQKSRPRLIEMAFPLKQASLASVHEKNVRHGHLSTLHIWPARRPLAASRAALLATLLSDPEDPGKRKTLLEEIGGQIGTKLVREQDDDGNTVVEEKEIVTNGLLAWGQEGHNTLKRFREEIHKAHGNRAPRVIDPFAGGGAIPLEAMRLGCEVTAADINPVAWFLLKCTLEYPQLLAGKTWPMPAFVKQWPDFIEDLQAGKVKKRRSGQKSHFNDPQQMRFFDLPHADLSWHVRAWGRWVLEKARQDLAARYPVVNGEPTVAYLWARTGRDKQTAGPIPLLKTFWLCRKAGRRAALLPIPSENKKSVSFVLISEDGLKSPSKLIEHYPMLKEWGVKADNLTDFLNKGTMNRAGVWSPLSGRPGMISLTLEDLRRQGQQGLLGSQMTAVVVERTEAGKSRKAYRLPTSEELDAADVDEDELRDAYSTIPFGVPDEPLPPPGTLGFRIPLYGFKKWKQVFTPRQLLAQAVLIKHSRLAYEQLKQTEPEIAEAVLGYLALNCNRVANRGSTLCMWATEANKIEQTFARFALPMKWDYCEAIPTEDYSGGYLGQLEYVAKYVSHAIEMRDGLPPKVVCRSALTDTDETYDAIVTDPPYYGAIPYSDLMDFFLIWLRRALFGINPAIDEAFKNSLGPKWDHEKADGELIDDDSRFDGDSAASKKSYEEGMAKAFATSLSKLSPDGRMFVVFANKEVDAWETLVGGLVKGGAVVTASWPVQTERAGGLRNLNRASLSSSVWLVCKKRAQSVLPGWEENVLESMQKTLFDPREALGGRNILQYYFDLGIRGPDFIWAALGPALEAYSAHPFVKKTAGGLLTVPEFLAEVRKLVLHFSLGELPGFSQITQQTQGRGESLEIDPITQYYLLHRAYFGLDPAPAGACIMYAQACGKSENELKMVWHIIEQGGKSKRGRPSADEIEDESTEQEEQSKGDELRLIAWQVRAEREDLGDTRSGQPAPLIDKLHRLMRLFQQNRTSEVQQLYDSWALANERAFVPLLQAVRELAVHDKQDTERRLVEALATQLKLNRKQVTIEEYIDNQLTLRVMETDAFEPLADNSKQAPVTYRASKNKRTKV